MRPGPFRIFKRSSQARFISHHTCQPPAGIPVIALSSVHVNSHVITPHIVRSSLPSLTAPMRYIAQPTPLRLPSLSFFSISPALALARFLLARPKRIRFHWPIRSCRPKYQRLDSHGSANAVRRGHHIANGRRSRGFSRSAATDTFARDAIIAWFRGEFAAANAIIDALCQHLSQIDGGSRRSEYEAVFAAIHRRRLNWIPVLHMQKYFSIADVVFELRRATAVRKVKKEEQEKEQEKKQEKEKEKHKEEPANGVCLESEGSSGDTSDQKIPQEGGEFALLNFNFKDLDCWNFPSRLFGSRQWGRRLIVMIFSSSSDEWSGSNKQQPLMERHAFLWYPLQDCRDALGVAPDPREMIAAAIWLAVL
ncbi:hypothetical protein ACLOJK_025901 [Asimina triloba]